MARNIKFPGCEGKEKCFSRNADTFQRTANKDRLPARSGKTLAPRPDLPGDLICFLSDKWPPGAPRPPSIPDGVIEHEIRLYFDCMPIQLKRLETPLFHSVDCGFVEFRGAGDNSHVLYSSVCSDDRRYRDLSFNLLLSRRSRIL